MWKYLALIAYLSCLSGCYTVNNEHFSANILAKVKPGMHMDAAISLLEEDGFRCDSHNGAPVISCTRKYRSFLFYPCVERVELFPNKEKAGVENIQIPKIVCTGL